MAKQATSFRLQGDVRDWLKGLTEEWQMSTDDVLRGLKRLVEQGQRDAQHGQQFIRQFKQSMLWAKLACAGYGNEADEVLAQLAEKL